MGLFFSGVDTDYFLFFYSGSIFFLTDFMNARRIWLEPKEPKVQGCEALLMLVHFYKKEFVNARRIWAKIYCVTLN